MSYIKADNLLKQYGEGQAAVLAVRGISFEIDEGEFVAIMGESGSGKSTLLSIMGALNTPTSGRFTVEDVDIYALKQDDRSVFRRDYLGFVFQTFHLVPYLTVAQNVMLPLATVKIEGKEKEDLAEEALERVGLAGKGHRLPSEISGGEQERVAVARAVVNHPPILLADEPTGNLDTKTAQGIMGLIRGLNDEGMTVVMVTHSSQCAQCAGRILRVSDGLLLNGKNPASACRTDGNGKTWVEIKSPTGNGLTQMQ